MNPRYLTFGEAICALVGDSLYLQPKRKLIRVAVCYIASTEDGEQRRRSSTHQRRVLAGFKTESQRLAARAQLQK